MVWDYLLHLVLYGLHLKPHINGGSYLHVLDLHNSNFYIRWKWNWFYHSWKIYRSNNSFCYLPIIYGATIFLFKKKQKKEKFRLWRNRLYRLLRLWLYYLNFYVFLFYEKDYISFQVCNPFYFFKKLVCQIGGEERTCTI